MARAEFVAPAKTDAWRATLSGLSASLVGIGLARFAYTPLLPALIAHGWFSAGPAAYLGAANLAGYLFGVIGSGAAARRFLPRTLLRGAMALAAVSFFACAWPGGFAWFFVWRILSGVAGAVAMVLAAPAVLPNVPPSRRGLVGGAIFMGIGVGVAASSTLVPLLARQGLTQAWTGLGVLALLLTLVGWNGWPDNPAPAAATHHSTPLRPEERRALAAVYVVYGLNAFGLVPHMVFLVDYVARGLGEGLDAGSQYWGLFGLGAIGGPLLLGHVADKIGHRTALRLALVLELVFVGLPALGLGPVSLAASSLIVGACTIGVVGLALGRTREILRHHPAAQASAWRTATTSFALMQAAGAYLLSFLFTRSGGDYRLLFGIGALAMALALGVECFAPSGRSKEGS
jgi:predicted MFS family arabinose efflux permease